MWLGVGLVGVVERLIFFEWRQFDGDSIGCGWLEIVAGKMREHHGNIIFTTAVVRFVDQRVTSL